MKPAATPPNGTDVCLTENRKFRSMGVVTLDRRCEAGGLVSAYPSPQNTEPTANTPRDGTAISSVPIADSTKAN